MTEVVTWQNNTIVQTNIRYRVGPEMVVCIYLLNIYPASFYNLALLNIEYDTSAYIECIIPSNGLLIGSLTSSWSLIGSLTSSWPLIGRPYTWLDTDRPLIGSLNLVLASDWLPHLVLAADWPPIHVAGHRQVHACVDVLQAYALISAPTVALSENCEITNGSIFYIQLGLFSIFITKPT